MARKFTSNIEQYTEAYITKIKGGNKLRSERKYLQKTLNIIEFYLGAPCCEQNDSEPGSVEFSRLDNSLTVFVKNNLNDAFAKRKYRKSLERTQRLIRQTLINYCCDPFEITVTFNQEQEDDAQVTFTDENGVIVFSTDTSSDLQTETIEPGFYKISFDVTNGTEATLLQGTKVLTVLTPASSKIIYNVPLTGETDFFVNQI